MQRKRNEGGGLAGNGLAILQRNRTVRSENRLAHNENRAVHNEDHHNIRRFSPKSRFSSNVVMVWAAVPLSHLEGDGDLDAAEVLLVGLVVARGVQVAKIESVADGLERMFVHAGDDGADTLGLVRHAPAAHA